MDPWQERMRAVELAFERDNPFEEAEAQWEDETISVLVASTEETRARGLIGVDGWAGHQGLAFVGLPARAGFHMEGVSFPIKVALVDMDGLVVEVAELAPGAGPWFPERAFHVAFELPVSSQVQLGDRLVLRS